MRNELALIALAVTILLPSGCDLITDSDVSELGIVEWIDVDPAVSSAVAPPIGFSSTAPTDTTCCYARITVPDTVLAGQEFIVEVTTWGVNGCWYSDHTDVSVEGNRAVVEAYDAYEDGGVCSMAVVALHHEATVQFDQVGTSTVEIRGRKVVGGDVESATVESYERAVVVIERPE